MDKTKDVIKKFLMGKKELDSEVYEAIRTMYLEYPEDRKENAA